MKKYAVTLSDGSLVITTLIEGTIEQAMDRRVWSEGRTLVSYTEVDVDQIPKDRTYRNAWRKKGDNLEVDLPEAKKIHMARIREKRNKLLEQEDLAFVTALSKDDTVEVEKIKQRKKKLRDVPQVIQSSVDQAATVEDLKKVEPQW